MDGVELAARFSIATNRLEYCGPAGADAVFYRLITEGTDRVPARAALGRFEALTPYLEAIGAKHDRDPFDLEVVEAYWIGNRLLDAFGREDFEAILTRLVRRGLPRKLAERLAKHLPAHPLPHHAFHVAFVGVGNVTGHVATTLANMESCRPGWGVVREETTERLTVAGPALRLTDAGVELGPERTLELRHDPRTLPGLRRGDAVALHWGTPTVRLDERQLARLREYTARSLAAANEGLPALRAARTSETPS